MGTSVPTPLVYRAPAGLAATHWHGSSTMSHVIPLRLFPILKLAPCNSNVCERRRILTEGNYVRDLGERGGGVRGRESAQPHNPAAPQRTQHTAHTTRTTHATHTTHTTHSARNARNARGSARGHGPGRPGSNKSYRFQRSAFGRNMKGERISVEPRPTLKPPITSVTQWTPRYRRVTQTNTMNVSAAAHSR